MPDETDGLFPPAGARDWPEDSAHENGRYWCTCSTCGQRFVGHKRRVVCRTCSMPDETQEREGSRDAVVVPRRIDRLRHTPAERAITDAMQVVEEMAADVRLTQAVILLGRARDLVADYVDGMPYRPAVDGPHAVIRAQEVTIDRLTRDLKEARDKIDRVRSALSIPVAEAMEYEGRLEASMYLSVDALNELRSFIALAEPEGAPALDTNSETLLARLDTLTPNELRRTLVDVLGERDVLVREVLLLRKATT